MAVSTLEHLKQAILTYDAEAAGEWATRAIEEGIDPIDGAEAMAEALRQVGDGFAGEELWLPDLVGAAHAMKSAAPILEEEIKRRGKVRKTLGTVVIGTVYGDIHDIGKNMVITLLAAHGFSVHDLGVNVSSDGFIAAVREQKPDILALSALMTMTAHEQVKIIAGLKNEGLRDQIKVIVGGAAITQEFADSVGADGYDPSAPGAVGLVKELLRID
jgi:methanogenic corrinoid protein MtbC1